MGEVVSKTFARLTPEVYADLERKLPAPFVARDTTELQAAFNLGVQHVLKLLREGYVIGK